MASVKSLHIADPMAWLDTLATAESLQVLGAFAVCVALAWLARVGCAPSFCRTRFVGAVGPAFD